MGSLTAKTSGEIASFMSPSVTNIKSLKVHFSPKQLGTGDPSPENVREIVGWDGVEVNHSSFVIKESSNENWKTGYVAGTGKITSSKLYRTTGFIEIKEDFVIKGSFINETTDSSWYGIGFYDTFKNYITRFSSYKDNWSILSPKTAKYMRISFNIASNIFIYKEPYQKDIISYQWKLPDEYQEVEYIESTGTQYIDTGIIGRPNIKVETNFELTDSTNISNCGFIGSRENSGTSRFYIISFYSNKWHLGLPSDFTSSTHPIVRNEIQNVIFQSIDGNYSLTVNGTEIYNGNSTFSTTYPMYLFGVNNYGTVSRQSSFKLYTLKIQQDGNYIRNYIPCYRKSDGEIGLYDLISQTFFTNQGTGEFLKGEDVFGDAVYGGYVDLISGELVETNVRDVLDTVNKEQLSTQYNTSQTVFFRCDTDYTFETKRSTVTGISDFYCESLSSVSMNWGDGDSQDSKVNTITQRYNSTKAVCMRMYNSVFDINADDTVEVKKQKINTWLADNPIVISYKLAEPITHQLTPTQLSSFIGQNNFWSNADYVEIEYDLIETIDIQKAKQKIILNQPHTESVIGDVANFSTNMKAPLKECKVYFSPIQEGSGDPSPDNVRNITGWDGVNIGLPNEYQEVEYIESSGTQYIITDIPIQQPVTIYIDVMPLSGSNDQAFFVASYEAGQTVRVGTGFYASRIQNYYQRYYTLGEPNSMKINTKHHAEVYLSQGLQTAVLDGTQLSNTRYTHDSTLLPIDGNKINFFMFAEGRLRASGKIDALFKSHARIYALKVDNADSTIGNFIPCYRKSDGEIGMYDIVSKTFYTNSGTGTFLKGDDVNTIIGNVNWSNEVGTVYGGYVDLTKGEVVATFKKIVIDGSFDAGIFPWSSDSTDINTGKIITNALYLKKNTGDNKHNRYAIFYCNKLKNISNYNRNEVGCSMYDGSSYSVTLTLPKEDVGDTQETLKTYLSNNPIEVIFELAEPIHYSLTPQQLLTFKGENNIWSDTNGQTEVKFWTH